MSTSPAEPECLNCGSALVMLPGGVISWLVGCSSSSRDCLVQLRASVTFPGVTANSF